MQVFGLTAEDPTTYAWKIACAEMESFKRASRVKGEAVCFQHEGYTPNQWLYSPNVYDHYTRKIIAIWRIKK